MKTAKDLKFRITETHDNETELVAVFEDSQDALGMLERFARLRPESEFVLRINGTKYVAHDGELRFN